MAITDTEQPNERTTDDLRAPWYVRDNYAPVPDEVEAFDLEVTGELPGHLDGLYVRNGANPKGPTPMHWFLGDGMLHGVRLRAGDRKSVV